MVAISMPMVMSAAKYARDDHRKRLASSSATTGTANDADEQERRASCRARPGPSSQARCTSPP